MPPHAFPILLIHFLQQEKKPVLPCIHDYLHSESETESYKSKLEANNSRLADLQPKSLMARSHVPNLGQLPVAAPPPPPPPQFLKLRFELAVIPIAAPIDEIESWKSRNAMSVGELWIEIFEYYSLGFNMNELVVSIRKVGGYTRTEKQWKGKKLVIEGRRASLLISRLRIRL